MLVGELREKKLLAMGYPGIFEKVIQEMSVS
jgi:hypothetical protein